jgi:aminoglycoside phosphotransferase (APT) family kinase protein
LPPFERARLARFLAGASGAREVSVTEPALLAGGAIRENWGFEADFAGGPFSGQQAVVLRTDGPTGIAASLGRVEEFAVLQAAFNAGVTAPEPLWACADPDVIGRPFFAMRRVAGTAQGRQITTDPALEPALPRIAARLAEELARIQTIRPPRPGLDFLPAIDAAAHIAGFRAYLDRHPNPRPVLEWATCWLASHLPEPLPPVLCHRDFRTGNYMLDLRPGGSELTGILDWEFAGWGDPDEDIGWLCCKGWRFARLDREAGGIAGRATFYEAYERASGRRLDPERVRFWEVLANVRWAVIALQQSDRHLIGGARDLSTAIIGRRATECDLELLMLLDPEPATQIAPSPPSGERVGVRGRTASPFSAPSPVRGLAPAATLSRGAGEGFGLRDLPSGIDLLALGRELLDDLLPLLPAERQRELRLVATAMAIAEREAAAGDAPAQEIAARLRAFYGPPENALSALQEGEGGDPLRSNGEGEVGVGRRPGIPYLTPTLSVPGDGEGDFCSDLLRRFAADLRAGVFEPCASRASGARAILRRLTILKLREGNPGFLAANGFGE